MMENWHQVIKKTEKRQKNLEGDEGIEFEKVGDDFFSMEHIVGKAGF